MNLIPLGWLLQPFPPPQSPLQCRGLASESTFPSSPLSSSAESLQATGAAAQRWFMSVFSQQAPATHIQISHRSSAERHTRETLRTLVAVSAGALFVQSLPTWGGFSLRGLVLRFSQGNQPLSPLAVRGRLRLADFSGILYGVRRYYLPEIWDSLPNPMLDLLKCAWQDSRENFLCSERDGLHGRRSGKADGQVWQTNVKAWAWQKRFN